MSERNANGSPSAHRKSSVTGLGIENSEGWRAGARWAGWLGLIIILLIPGEGGFFFIDFFLFFHFLWDIFWADFKVFGFVLVIINVGILIY